MLPQSESLPAFTAAGGVAIVLASPFQQAIHGFSCALGVACIAILLVYRGRFLSGPETASNG